MSATRRCAVYNENDPKTVAWLTEIVRRGLIEDGQIDSRSITEVQPDDCAPRSHFFAGIGGWPYALRLAGWPADRPVWTGSCPCQPFSVAGRGRGADDPRHLWPEWLRLIRECRPATIFGEQVASKAGREWLAGVRADLEALGYAVGAADLCAAGVGAPHIRQRLFWVAHSIGNGDQRRAVGGVESGEAGSTQGEVAERERRWTDSGGGGAVERLADPDGRLSGDGGLQRGGRLVQQPQDEATGGVGDATGWRRSREGGTLRLERAGCVGWSFFDLLPCADGKSRRVESGTFPLAHGVPARVGRLRGYGNAIVPQIAAEFVRAFMEATA